MRRCLIIHQSEQHNQELWWLSFMEVPLHWRSCALHSPSCKNSEGVGCLPSLRCCSEAHVPEWIWFSWHFAVCSSEKRLLDLETFLGRFHSSKYLENIFSEEFPVCSSWVLRGGGTPWEIWVLPEWFFGQDSSTVFWSDHIYTWLYCAVHAMAQAWHLPDQIGSRISRRPSEGSNPQKVR